MTLQTLVQFVASPPYFAFLFLSKYHCDLLKNQGPIPHFEKRGSWFRPLWCNLPSVENRDCSPRSLCLPSSCNEWRILGEIVLLKLTCVNLRKSEENLSLVTLLKDIYNGVVLWSFFLTEPSKKGTLQQACLSVFFQLTLTKAWDTAVSDSNPFRGQFPEACFVLE